MPELSQVWPDMSDWRLDRRRPALLPGHMAGAEDSGLKRRFLLFFVLLSLSLFDFLDDRRRRREKRFFLPSDLLLLLVRHLLVLDLSSG